MIMFDLPLMRFHSKSGHHTLKEIRERLLEVVLLRNDHLDLPMAQDFPGRRVRTIREDVGLRPRGHPASGPTKVHNGSSRGPTKDRT